MKQRFKIKSIVFITSLIIIFFYLAISSIIGNSGFKNLKSLLNKEQRYLIKKYLFPYKLISEQEQRLERIPKLEQRISQLDDSIKSIRPLLLNSELSKKESGSDIVIKRSEIKLSSNLNLKKYQLTTGFYAGIYNSLPGSGYIDFYDENIIILSSKGILAFKKDLNDVEENFQQIQNNVNEFISIEQFNKITSAAIRDLFIFKGKIYVSYNEEIEEDCWNTSIVSGNFNYEKIVFKKFFSTKECVRANDNIDKVVGVGQSGGRITSIDDNHILFSIGAYASRYLAQDKKSINGKIIKININNSKYEIISMGHRNPQGLYFDKENNYILETEHGPMGGDEINLIENENSNKYEVQNFGWAIASYGEHYGGKEDIKNKIKYEKYPLYKSHIEHGFIEPLISFVPSIAISQIIKISKNRYVVSSMGRDRDGDKSLYFFELTEEREIRNLQQVKVFERIRDLSFKDNKLYLFMEDTSSIGVIKLSETIM